MASEGLRYQISDRALIKDTANRAASAAPCRKVTIATPHLEVRKLTDDDFNAPRADEFFSVNPLPHSGTIQQPGPHLIRAPIFFQQPFLQDPRNDDEQVLRP